MSILTSKQKARINANTANDIFFAGKLIHQDGSYFFVACTAHSVIKIPRTSVVGKPEVTKDPDKTLFQLDASQVGEEYSVKFATPLWSQNCPTVSSVFNNTTLGQYDAKISFTLP